MCGALAVHPRDDRVLYLGTEQGLFRSENGADSWTRIDGPLNGMQIWSVLVVPRQPDVIVVGTCPSRIFVSADAGRTWQEGGSSMRQDCPRIIYTRVTSLLADPDEPDTIWAGVEIDGLFRSRDLGRSWERVGQGLSSQDIHALAKVSDKTMLAATNNDLNVSRDGGLNWRAADNRLDHAVVLLPNTGPAPRPARRIAARQRRRSAGHGRGGRPVARRRHGLAAPRFRRPRLDRFSRTARSGISPSTPPIRHWCMPAASAVRFFALPIRGKPGTS